MKNYCFIPHHYAWWGEAGFEPAMFLRFAFDLSAIPPLWSVGSHSVALIQLKTDGKSASASAV